MTEQDWRDCTDPQRMLDFLWGRVKDRKLRLFDCACCRRIWHLLSDARSRCLVEIVEQYADGLVTIFDVAAAWDAHQEAYSNYDFKAPWYAAMYAGSHSEETAHEAADAAGCETWWASIPDEDPILNVIHSAGASREEKAQCDILRDLFGSVPFRSVHVSPAWRNAMVISLAHAIYDERAFDRLPILGDALEDAGCSDAEIVSHCREPGPHIRGCWVVDLVLGKE